MKLIKFFPFLAFLVLTAACQDNQRQTTEADDALAAEDGTDLNRTGTMERNEGTRDWDEAWNNNDLQGLRDMTANDAVLLLNTEVRTGEGINSWFETNAPIMQNLQTTAEVSSEGENMAYEAGSYTHNVQGAEGEFEGAYTIIWERTDEDWKIKAMDISNVPAAEGQDSEE